MNTRFVLRREEPENGLLMIPLFEKEGVPEIVSKETRAAISLIEEKEFSGKVSQQILIREKKKKILLYGLGERKEFAFEKLRIAGATLSKKALETSEEKISAFVPKEIDEKEGVIALVQGILLYSYRFDKYVTKKENSIEVKEVNIVSKESEKELSKAISYAIASSECTNFARDISNESGEEGLPEKIAEKIINEAKANGVKARELSEKELRKQGWNALLAVSSGSIHSPKVIVLEYAPPGKEKEKPIVLVGKGITFDSGGISIKPSENMEKMKHDKSGAAAVAAATICCSRLKIPERVIAVIPLCENLPSGSALKPGDVLKSFSGKTIEVINTDAEGRLILADALAYAVKELNPRALIDVATLTGGVVVALGDVCIGMMGTSKQLMEKIREAGEKEWERVWELPLYKEYEEKIKSQVADIKNIGGTRGEASSIIGGIFLKNFVKETPWVHLDIAGTAWTEKNDKYSQSGATGVGTRLLTRMIAEEIK